MINEDEHITNKTKLLLFNDSCRELCNYCGLGTCPADCRGYVVLNENCINCRVNELYNQAKEELRILNDASILGCTKNY